MSQTNPHPTTGTRRLPANRLRLVSTDTARFIAIGTGIGFVLLVVGLGAIGIALIRPLGVEADAETVAPPMVRVPTPPGSAASNETIAALTSDNPYAPGRRAFGTRPVRVAEDAPAEAQPEPTIPARPEPGGTAQTSTGEVLILQDINTVPDPVKLAFLNLKLNAIFQHPRTGEWVAMLVFNDVGDQARGFLVAEGGEFSDPSYPKAPWRVRRVDISRSRIILSRSESTLALELYESTAPRAAVAQGDDAAAEDDGIIRIEHRTREEVIAELEAEGWTASEIEYMLADIDQIARLGPDAPPAAPLTPEALDRIAGEVAARETPGEPPTGEDGEPVFGMAELLRMMQTGENPVEVQERNERARRERQNASEPK